MTKYEYDRLMGRTPKHDCKYCYGDGDECIDTQKEDWGDTTIDMPIYAPCRCLARWYDAPIGLIKEWWLWNVTYKRIEDDDIPF